MYISRKIGVVLLLSLFFISLSIAESREDYEILLKLNIDGQPFPDRIILIKNVKTGNFYFDITNETGEFKFNRSSIIKNDNEDSLEIIPCLSTFDPVNMKCNAMGSQTFALNMGVFINIDLVSNSNASYLYPLEVSISDSNLVYCKGSITSESNQVFWEKNIEPVSNSCNFDERINVLFWPAGIYNVNFIASDKAGNLLNHTGSFSLIKEEKTVKNPTKEAIIAYLSTSNPECKFEDGNNTKETLIKEGEKVENVIHPLGEECEININKYSLVGDVDINVNIDEVNFSPTLINISITLVGTLTLTAAVFFWLKNKKRKKIN